MCDSANSLDKSEDGSSVGRHYDGLVTKRKE